MVSQAKLEAARSQLKVCEEKLAVLKIINERAKAPSTRIEKIGQCLEHLCRAIQLLTHGDEG